MEYPSLQYAFTVPNGFYDVRLKFAEIWYPSTGQRVFHVNVNGQTVDPSFDIVSAAGGAFRAVDRVFRIRVTSGSIVIQLVSVISNPKISAIEITPMPWKAITYSPRRHAYPRMLYDWYSFDWGVYKSVYQMADEDLTRLAQGGFNVIHHYVWDKKLLPDLEPSGFPNAPISPQLASNRQWEAINDFVARAEARGLYVIIHFASQTLIDDLQAGVDPEATGQARLYST
jgi:hypothetical protein